MVPMSDAGPYERFRVWFDELKERGVHNYQVAQRLGCDPAEVSRTYYARRCPNLKTATAIEHATEGWHGGQIRASEWIGAQMISAPRRTAKVA